jgi:hypothetical protein
MLVGYARRNFRSFPFRGQVMDQSDVSNPSPFPIREDPSWAVHKLIHPAGGDIFFLPLVIRAQQMSLVCELDIRIFWREKRQGGILMRPTDGGMDLDNRLSSLLDALTVPQVNGLPKVDEPNPVPVLCLLENDNLVTKITIEA